MDAVKKIVARVLSVEINALNDDFSRQNSEEWDSFNHLLLISELEKELGTKFTMSEIENIKTLGELQELILKKGSL